MVINEVIFVEHQTKRTARIERRFDSRLFIRTNTQMFDLDFAKRTSIYLKYFRYFRLSIFCLTKCSTLELLMIGLIQNTTKIGHLIDKPKHLPTFVVTNSACLNKMARSQQLFVLFKQFLHNKICRLQQDSNYKYQTKWRAH